MLNGVPKQKLFYLCGVMFYIFLNRSKINLKTHVFLFQNTSMLGVFYSVSSDSLFS